MAAFHVFVEGATDGTPAGVARLAESIAQHYGLPAADLLARLKHGRFRVKANADRATAESYVRDLERLGARCTIEEATAANSQRTTPTPFPAVAPPRTTTPPTGLAAAAPSPARTTTPPSGLAAAAPTPARTTTPPSGLAAAAPTPARTTTPPSGLAAAAPTPARTTTPPAGLAAAAPSIARTTTPPSGLGAAAGSAASGSQPAASSGQFQSGLSAAFSGEMPAADLGALGREDAPFSLATVDGADDSEPRAAAAFEPPGGDALSASIGPAPEKPKAGKPAGGKPAKPKDEPLDMFAPPEMQGDEFKVDIADDDKDVAARRASTPPPTEEQAATRPSSQKIPTGASQPIPKTPAPATGGPAPARPSQPALATTEAPVAVVAPSRFGPLGEPRVRFAAGVILAVLLGFVPAHFIAKMREESAYAEVDRKVIAAQQQADTPDVYATLDRLRADQLSRKESEQRNAAIIGFAIWALVGAGIAFVWFKKIPWDA